MTTLQTYGGPESVSVDWRLLTPYLHYFNLLASLSSWHVHWYFKMKTFLKRMDKKFFGGIVQAVRREKYENRSLRAINSGQDHKFITYYKKNHKNYFSSLCDKYGSDKGEISDVGHPYPWPSHTYADFYSRLFDHCRNGVKRVFECGLGTNNAELASSMGASGMPGASLRVWRDYFPNAEIYGADIDRSILFNDTRIKTFYVDQTDQQSISNLWSQVGAIEFDVMVDDGLHVFEAGACLFENSIGMLSKCGLYIIEDVLLPDLEKYEVYFSDKDYQVDYVILVGPRVSGLYSNNLVVVRHSRG